MDNIFLATDYDCHNELRVLEVPPSLHGLLTGASTSDFYYLSEVGRHSSGSSASVSESSKLLLCSSKQCFGVRKIEYSNSLVVSTTISKRPRDDDCARDHCSAKPRTLWLERQSRIFEVSQARPQTVQAILKLCRDYVTLEELDESRTPLQTTHTRVRRFTFPSLVAESACSAGELSDALRRWGALMVRGFVRVLHPEVIACMVRDAVMFLDASEAMQVDDVDGSDTALPRDISMIHSNWMSAEAYLTPDMYPSVAVRCAASCVMSPDRKFLSLAQVTVYLSRVVFSTAASKRNVELMDDSVGSASAVWWVPLTDFVSSLRGLLPLRLGRSYYGELFSRCEQDGAPDAERYSGILEVLRGHVLLRCTGSGAAAAFDVAWAPQWCLPGQLDERVQLLFKWCPGRWSAADLKAYVEPLLDPGVTFDVAVSRVCKDIRIPGKSVMYALLT